jgi:endonuclease/exonuclease/phosphatase family metal-dependent hydrolase
MPGRLSTGDDVPNATEVVLDFLAILMAEIDARGGGYRVVGEAINVDAECRSTAGRGPVRSAPHRSGRDARARHGPDVELHRAAVRREVRVRRGRQRRHPIALTRSTSRVDAVLGDAHFTFANAHLEIQSLQLVPDRAGDRDAVGIASVPDPVLLLGDFNSSPGMNSYPLLTRSSMTPGTTPAAARPASPAARPAT